MAAYQKRQATWQPGADPAVLQWNAVRSPPALRPIGRLAGGRLIHVIYDAGHHLVLWELAKGRYRPVLMLDGDVAIMERVYDPELFEWNGQSVVLVRVLISGSGKSQLVTVLTARASAVHALSVNHAPLNQALAERQLQLPSKLSFFCSRSLIFTSGLVDSRYRHRGYFFADYAVGAEDVRMESIRIALDGEPDIEQACEMPY